MKVVENYKTNVSKDNEFSNKMLLIGLFKSQDEHNVAKIGKHEKCEKIDHEEKLAKERIIGTRDHY